MEDKKISIPKLKTLIRKGKIEELLTNLLEVTVGKDELQKNIISLTSKHKHLRRQNKLETLSDISFNNELNEIILELENIIAHLNNNELNYSLIEKIVKEPVNSETIWLLIEDGPGFSTELRNQIYSEFNDTKFKIRDYFREKKTILNESSKALVKYHEAFQKFIFDRSAKWLLTVFPEEERSDLLSGDREEMLKQLIKNEKYMICFESGFSLLKPVKNKFNKQYSNLKIICSDHKRSISNLLKSALIRLKRDDRLHVIVVPGPNNPIANERLEIKLEFIYTLLDVQTNHLNALAKSFESKGNFDVLIQNIENRFESVHISTLNFNSWDRFDAKDKISGIINNLSINDTNIHTCFLCVNDDVALGVGDAIKEFEENNKMLRANVSLFGFDGIQDMKEYISKGGYGGTMEVDFESFCKVAMDFINYHEKSTDIVDLISAKMIISKNLNSRK